MSQMLHMPYLHWKLFIAYPNSNLTRYPAILFAISGNPMKGISASSFFIGCLPGCEDAQVALWISQREEELRP